MICSAFYCLNTGDATRHLICWVADCGRIVLDVEWVMEGELWR